MMVDSGWNTRDTYQFCETHPGVMPCKGSSTDLGGLPYKVVGLSDGAGGPGRRELLHVGTDYWETDVQSRLEDKLAGEPGSLTLPEGSGRDIEFVAQICNGHLKDVVDSRGNARMMWVKKEESQPNDFRDCLRYRVCLARAWLDDNGGQMPLRTQNTRTEKTFVQRGETRPDGRAWHD